MDPAIKFGYYRGVGWYARIINIPVEWEKKRIFVRFEAAGQVARVHVNGQMLGNIEGPLPLFVTN